MKIKLKSILVTPILLTFDALNNIILKKYIFFYKSTKIPNFIENRFCFVRKIFILTIFDSLQVVILKDFVLLQTFENN